LNSPALFDTASMAAAVEVHWQLYGRSGHIRSLGLYILLISDFVVCTIWFHALSFGTLAERITAWALQAIKLVLALWFLRKELRQLQSQGGPLKEQIQEYFTDPWNLLDLSAYALLFIGVAAQVSTRKSLLADCTNSIVALLLWFKLLYFMRPFRSTGPLINTIFEIMADMRTFLVILLVVVVGFANAFYAILGRALTEQECDEKSTSTARASCYEKLAAGPSPSFSSPWKAVRSSLSYMLGGYDLDELDAGSAPVLLSLLWLACMLLVTIILLNVLIAIISER
ncbi:Ion transport protein-domain-containing protein, partial [Tribonema minus]